MKTEDGYYVKSLDDVIDSIERTMRRKVALLPYPMDSERKRYYITDDGNVFFSKIMDNRAFVIQRHHENRPSTEKFVRLSIGNKKEVSVAVAQCLYNAFILGIWSELRPEFRNGDRFDCTLSNLYIPVDSSITIKIDKMYDSVELYRKHFVPICRYLSYNFKLSKEDAEDVVQTVFIYVTCTQNSDDVLTTWIWYSKKRAIDYIRRMNVAFPLDYDPYYFNKEFEFPLYEILRVKKDRDVLSLRCNGYSNAEIADALSISKGNVEARISRALTLIKRVLKRDIEFYGKRRSI